MTTLTKKEVVTGAIITISLLASSLAGAEVMGKFADIAYANALGRSIFVAYTAFSLVTRGKFLRETLFGLYTLSAITIVVAGLLTAASGQAWSTMGGIVLDALVTGGTAVISAGITKGVWMLLCKTAKTH